jgi:hypothetical protein
MTRVFCAEPAFEGKVGWIEALVADELYALEHLPPTLSRDALGSQGP